PDIFILCDKQFFSQTDISMFLFFFFFQAEDGIRDYKVTGVQTCALPILPALVCEVVTGVPAEVILRAAATHRPELIVLGTRGLRSEERRVGKECRSRWSAQH